MFDKDNLSALQAISQAQSIAFAPYVFQASVLLRDRGLLRLIEKSRAGIGLDDIVENANGMSKYAVRVLLEAGLGIGLLYFKEEKYHLAKTGHFFLNDKMTEVNTNFMRDVCYDGAQDLATALDEGKPAGLRHLGDWETIYQGLSILEEPAKKSWFDFDHYYSDRAFPHALEVVFGDKYKPKRMMDIGSNTGKFTIACLSYDADVFMGMVDLPVQLNVAVKNLEEDSLSKDRYAAIAHDVLINDKPLPTGYDAIWMSQFLDCFSDNQIVEILEKCFKALPDDGHVFINETFWDRQRFPASAFSLQMTSLYFTTMANGNSQMYSSVIFKDFIEKSGFKVLETIDNVGLGHTILVLGK